MQPMQGGKFTICFIHKAKIATLSKFYIFANKRNTLCNEPCTYLTNTVLYHALYLQAKNWCWTVKAVRNESVMTQVHTEPPLRFPVSSSHKLYRPM